MEDGELHLVRLSVRDLEAGSRDYESAGSSSAEGPSMPSNVPPLLIEIILSGPEVVAAERALAGALERSGFPVGDGDHAADPAALDVLPAVHWRWKQQADRLNSSACALAVDGFGLLVVSVPVLDVPVVIMALKSRLFDLIIESRITGIDGDDKETEMIMDLIGRLEAGR